jgi:hypothetical protein
MALRGTAGNSAGAVTTVVVTVSGIGIVNGDIVLLFANVYGTAPSLTFPTGFTVIPSLTQEIGGNCALQVAWKVASSEPTTYTLTSTANFYGSAQCRVYSGRNSSQFTATQTTASTSLVLPNTATATGLTAANGDDVVVVYAVPLGGSADTMAFTTPTNFANPLITQNTSTAFVGCLFGADHVGVTAGATGGIVTSVSDLLNTSSTFGAAVLSLAQTGGGGGTGSFFMIPQYRN